MDHYDDILEAWAQHPASYELHPETLREEEIEDLFGLFGSSSSWMNKLRKLAISQKIWRFDNIYWFNFTSTLILTSMACKLPLHYHGNTSINSGGYVSRNPAWHLIASSQKYLKSMISRFRKRSCSNGFSLTIHSLLSISAIQSERWNVGLDLKMSTSTST